MQNPIDALLNKFTLRKTLRILSWINRFLNNCRKSKVSGPITAKKVLVQRNFLIKKDQNLYSTGLVQSEKVRKKTMVFRKVREFSGREV